MPLDPLAQTQNPDAAAGLATVSTPPDEAVLYIRRSFTAPRDLVWRCYTDPAHLVRFWGPKGATIPVCEVDLRVGGVWRTVMRFASGNEYGYSSVYLEIAPPERLLWRDAPLHHREGDELGPVEMLTELVLTEQDGQTRLLVTVRFNNVAARDEAVRQGFASTVLQGNDKLAEYLETLIDQSAGN